MKTWIEPELTEMNITGGPIPGVPEVTVAGTQS
jgi:hypothetical protein